MAWIIKAYIPIESEDTEMYATREDAENEEEAIQEARSEQDAPLKQSAFVKSFEPIFETLDPWKECDTAKLKKNQI
jgi:hypothetical protein